MVAFVVIQEPFFYKKALKKLVDIQIFRTFAEEI